MRYVSTKTIPIGSCAFRQWRADSHCKFIHGYRLSTKIWLTCEKLDNNNWVFDFGNFKQIKKELEYQFDHTFCVSKDDPELETFKHLHKREVIDLRIMDAVGIEKTAEWIFNHCQEIVSKQTNNRVKLIKVEVWEHEGNSAIYEEDCSKQNKNKELDNYKEVKNNKPNEEVENKKLPEIKDDVVPLPNDKTPPLYNKVTKGLSNPFEGTSWG